MNRRVAMDALRVTFAPTLKLEFHGTKVTSDAGANTPVTLATRFVKKTSDACNRQKDFDIIVESKGLVV
jgi:hypothetical protein